MTRILITNDDGIESAVLLPLARALADHADVTVVVPDRQQSGVGHGFTFHDTLTFAPLNHEDVDFYTVRGTPADCVKFALCKLLQNETFDLVISGVNDQLNTGVAIYYSGTVAGAREAALMGVPGLAISAVNFNPENLGYGIAWLVEFVKKSLYKQIPDRKYWNVNLPDCTGVNSSTPGTDEYPVKGVKFCEMGQVMYEDGYFHLQDGEKVDAAEDAPQTDRDYQLIGQKPEAEMREGDDDFEQLKGYVTITPLTLDMGDAAELARLNKMNEEFNNQFIGL